MPAYPTGTVTFLFSDIEGSTRLWQQYPEAMKAAVSQHDLILKSAVEVHSGYIVKTTGDGLLAAFAIANDAVAAAVDAQRGLSSHAWGETEPLRVRMGLHTGPAQERDGDYFGPTLNRAARLMAIGHGGQVLLSLATYELVRDHLPEGVTLRDLGEGRLKDLARPEHIYQVVARGLPADFPTLRTLDARANNLPVQRDPLIGREKEVAAVRDLLMRPSAGLVTLTGPGGTGKTRLALQLGADLLDQFDDGVFLVDLAPITDAPLVASTIAQALGIREQGGRPIYDVLKDDLHQKSLLLILDNFEQVTVAAPLVSDLLAAASKLKVLVTSREALHLRGEREFAVPPLSAPNPKEWHGIGVEPILALSQFDAVRLFIERAKAVKPDFAVTNDNAPAVAEICYRLDGLPLAIELAAARVKLLSPQAMLPRLTSSLKLLTGGARDLPQRQQTLRDAIAWSYDLLSKPERTLFRGLGVFVGGFTLEAAEAICNPHGEIAIDVMDGIAGLVDKSLLRSIETDDGQPRFTMLETIREYALDRLLESGEAETVERQHLAFFLSLVEAAEPELYGPQAFPWLKRLGHDYDNLRDSLRRSVEDNDTDSAYRLVAGLSGFWFQRSLASESQAWLAKVMMLPPQETPTRQRAKVLMAAAQAAYESDFARARALFEASIAIWREVGDERGLAEALMLTGLLTWDQGDYRTSETDAREAEAIFTELGDRMMVAVAHHGLGLAVLGQGDTLTARKLIEESTEVFRALGVTLSLGYSLLDRGRILLIQGDYGTARASVEESLAVFKEIPHQRGIGMALHNLGFVATHMADYPLAMSLHRQGLIIAQTIGDRGTTIDSLIGFAELAHAAGQPHRAVQWLVVAAEARRAMGGSLTPTEHFEYERTLSALRTQLDKAEFGEASAQGHAMTLDRAVAYALEGDDLSI